MIGSAVSCSTCPKTRKGLKVDGRDAMTAPSTPVTGSKTKPAILSQQDSCREPSVATILKQQLPSRPRPMIKAPQSGRNASGGYMGQRCPPPPAATAGAVNCEPQTSSAASIVQSDHPKHISSKHTASKHTASKQSSTKEASSKMVPTDRRMSISSLLSNTNSLSTAAEAQSDRHSYVAHDGANSLFRSSPIHLPPLTQAMNSTAIATNQPADPFYVPISAQDTYGLPSTPLTDPAMWSLQGRSSATPTTKHDWHTVSTGCQKNPQKATRQEHHRSSRHSSHPYAIPSTRAAPRQAIEERSSSPATSSSLPANLGYSLHIRQHPVAARACGFGDRDRRVIDPPPVVELQIHDHTTGKPASDGGVFAMSCTLLNEDGTAEAIQLSDPNQWVRPTVSKNCLIGSLVASPFEGLDDNGAPGTFFVFSDLSCRMQGAYRLHFCLLRLAPGRPLNGSIHQNAGTVVSDVFTSHTAKDFPGMMPSTPLVRALKTQGLNIVVRAGMANRARVRARGTGMRALAREVETVERLGVQSVACKGSIEREEDDDDYSPSEEEHDSEVDDEGGFEDHNIESHSRYSRRLPLPNGSSSNGLRPVRGKR